MDAQNPDLSLGVEFFTKPVENRAQSAEMGRPIYEDREFVKISFPADTKREHVAPAHESHYVPQAKRQMSYAERFAASYQAFQDNRADFLAGTPLAMLPGLSDARRAELNALKIVTIEQLAGLPDAARKRLGMGALELQKQAQAFLERAEGTAETDALRRQVAELEERIAALGAAPTEAPDPFEGLGNDDLKNMIRDAGGEVPRGKVSRDVLIARLSEIADDKEAAA